MAKFWDRIVDGAVAVGIAEREVATPAPEVHPSAPPAPRVSGFPAPAPPKADIDALDQRSRTNLVTAMRAAKAPLVEDLGDMLETLRDSIPDEGSLYKAALKILAKKGFAVTAIREDYDKCIGALEASSREFAAQLKGQLDARVGAKLKTVEDCNQQIAGKQKQIAALQEEAAALAVTAHEAQNGITDEQAKLNLMQERFTINYQALRTEMERNCAKVTQYGEKI